MGNKKINFISGKEMMRIDSWPYLFDDQFVVEAPLSNTIGTISRPGCCCLLPKYCFMLSYFSKFACCTALEIKGANGERYTVKRDSFCLTLLVEGMTCGCCQLLPRYTVN